MPAGFETVFMSNSDLEHYGEISVPVLVPTPFPLNWQTIRAKLRNAGARAKKSSATQNERSNRTS